MRENSTTKNAKYVNNKKTVYPIEKININFSLEDKKLSIEKPSKKRSKKFPFFQKEKKPENLIPEGKDIELIFSSMADQNKYLEVVLDFPELYALSDHKTLSNNFVISRNDNNNIQINTDKIVDFKEFVYYLYENDLIPKSTSEEFKVYLKSNGFDNHSAHTLK